MKGIMFGLGMIGAKHAKILKENFQAELFSFQSKSNSPHVSKNLNSLNEAIQISPDFVLISNPTYKHLETLEQCFALNCPVFLEKPIDSERKNLEEMIKKAKSSVVYVAYCLRFNPVIVFIRDYLKSNRPTAISIHCSNNLSFWPRNSSQSYSSSFEKGGGVVLDLSHEIDYLNFISPIKKINFSNARKNGNVTDDAPDTLFAEFETEYCDAVVNINYQSHFRERGFKIDFNDKTIVGDIRANRIDFYEKFEKVNSKTFDEPYDEMYVKQWKYFFENKNNPSLMNNLSDALPVFELLCKMNKKC